MLATSQKFRLTSEKKMKKLYLSNTTLLFSLCEEPDYDRVVENLIINYSGSHFFWRNGGFEVDCIFLKDGSVVPVESKYSGNIRKRDIKGLMKFLKDFSVDAGYVVTIDAEADAMMGGRQVVFMPLWGGCSETDDYMRLSHTTIVGLSSHNRAQNIMI